MFFLSFSRNDKLSPLDDKLLHSGGDLALSDLESDHGDVFFRGPEAVEFLGRRVEDARRFRPPALAATAGVKGGGGGGGDAGSEPARFYTRAAVVCWPRSKRCGVYS